ncbi:hypothetical protein ACIP98_38600 [Streptomyces sp. NPDC088354]|uniref:hypothetical protein n=1 Tax=Streptomyces sp. NPDC088354 TaxID=3365856 RepID=UPI003811CB47
MPYAKADIHVSHAQYWLAELGTLDAIRPEMYQHFNGLVSAHEYLAIVMTGTEFGVVSLSVDWRETEPLLDFGWDEIVEVSMLFEDEPGALFGPRDQDAHAFPQISPGSYRVRFHARGRDRACAARTVLESPLEEHLVVAWPAPSAPEVVHKLTDSYGAEIR